VQYAVLRCRSAVLLQGGDAADATVCIHAEAIVMKCSITAASQTWHADERLNLVKHFLLFTQLSSSH
jgi:hypothetical protein